MSIADFHTGTLLIVETGTTRTLIGATSPCLPGKTADHTKAAGTKSVAEPRPPSPRPRFPLPGRETETKIGTGI